LGVEEYVPDLDSSYSSEEGRVLMRRDGDNLHGVACTEGATTRGRR